MYKNDISNKLIIVGGPTASGKSSLAINLAKKINGFLINADSVQVYKYLNIGSNKENLSFSKTHKFENIELPVFDIENSGILISLIDFLNPNDQFDLNKFKNYAEKLIEYAHAINKVPIVVGGTGLYIDSLIHNYKTIQTKKSFFSRESLNKMSLEKLKKLIDQDILEKLNNSDQNNPRRLIRLIEKRDHYLFEPRSTNPHILFYPDFEKPELFGKIDNRVEFMFDFGFVEEVKNLLSMGYTKELKSLQSTGYKEVIMFLEDQITFEECKELIKLHHRQYAKRQITWFEGKARNYNLVKVKNAEEANNYLCHFEF